ncbi:hypothetical protein BJF81_02420 [Ornithinimicrobium sp. CNJ-824]|uniref:hypothetical protein n=1 Tax=Ornithinimicrobium sp. CNJ-824 TaxID=1904966 RepID=UPI0009610587|nr:hypothetical protein [Ornithinimicrobium sp. CNJ-824]OLT21412.1 hypothetical protein BJF81_02420 [Ornithinimicrobium sp. CNJ-824]
MTRPRDAAELLCSVLALPRYRRRWVRHVRRMAPSASVHHAAVAEVIVRHLVESGELDGNAPRPARTYKDLVGRALTGRTLSCATLQLFVDAFEIEDELADRLWSTLLGDRVRSG